MKTSLKDIADYIESHLDEHTYVIHHVNDQHVKVTIYVQHDNKTNLFTFLEIYTDLSMYSTMVIKYKSLDYYTTGMQAVLHLQQALTKRFAVSA